MVITKFRPTPIIQKRFFMSKYSKSDTNYAYMITANHLLSGEVIYWDNAGKWKSALEQVHLFRDEVAAKESLAQAVLQSHIAVGVYVVKVASDNKHQRPNPDHIREILRAKGPGDYVYPVSEFKQVA